MNRPSSHASRLLKSRICPEQGQAIAEFSLTIIFLVILMMSILEMVIFMHAYNVLADSAKEGVRYAIVHGANNSQPMGPSCPCADIDGPPAPSGTIAGYGSGYGVVKTFAQYSLHRTTSMAVTVTYGPADTPSVTPLNKTPNRVQVTISYPYQPIFGLSWLSVTMRAAAAGRIMN